MDRAMQRIVDDFTDSFFQYISKHYNPITTWNPIVNVNRTVSDNTPLTQSKLSPQLSPIINKALLKLKAAYASSKLLTDQLGCISDEPGGEHFDLTYYRMKIEECGPILNSLCDRIESGQAILRTEAERQCKKDNS